jgi:MurNAc alpha-1-phosphate uridylyltransferase
MKAMILAAGRGERMRPLTDSRPKPLMIAGGKTLIEHQIERLHQAGITEIVINTAWLGEQIEQKLGDGAQLGVIIQYSRENEALETAGGLIQALPLLGDEPFVLANADAWCDFDFTELTASPLGNALARLVLIDTPDYLAGDFGLEGEQIIHKTKKPPTLYTYSGIALISPALLAGLAPGKRPFLPVFEAAMAEGKLHGQHFSGQWMDIGTPERLQMLQQMLG